MFKLELSYYDIIKRILVFLLIVITLKLLIFHLTPFFLALLIALVVEKPISLLTKKIPRLPAVFFVLAIFFFLVIFLLLILLSNFVGELIELGRLLPQYREQIIGGFENFIQLQEEFYELIPDEFSELITEAIESIYQRANILFTQLVDRIVNFTFNVPMFFVFIIFTVLSSFYLTKDRQELLDYLSQRVNLTGEERAKLLRDFGTYIKVQLTIITNTTFWVGLTLTIMDFPYAILLALAAGILDLIPVVGPGGVLWPLMVLHLFLNPLYSFIFFAIYVFVIGFRYFMEARILGSNIGVHPLVLLFGLFVGFNLLGFQGIILAPLSIIIFKVLLVAKVL